MTDLSSPTNAQAPDLHTSKAAHERLRRRYRSEAAFKYLGMSAVLVAVVFLALLLWTIVGNAYLAFTYHYVNLPVLLEQAAIDPDKSGDPTLIAKADYGGFARNAVEAVLPFAKSRQERRARNGLLTSDAGIQLREAVLARPSLIGTAAKIPVQLDDIGDLYFKGKVTGKKVVPTSGTVTPSGLEETVEIVSTERDFVRIRAAIRDSLTADMHRISQEVSAKKRSQTQLESRISDMAANAGAAAPSEKEALQARLDSLRRDLKDAVAAIDAGTKQVEALGARVNAAVENEPLPSSAPSFFIHINGGIVKATEVTSSGIEGEVLVPLRNADAAAHGDWRLEMLTTAQDNRKLSDREIAWLDYMQEQGLIEERFNSVFFTAGASREPEQAGILGAVMGSFYTMIVTLLLSFPVGVAAAVYLEEFAPKNRFTQIVEVNINNLAAVPSIVFGLLGLAVFLNTFGLPRSAPLVGGMVLALMTLPTIIIAARAALRSVPPSIREAALGIGASRLQAVLHHVLPLAMPGILTGTIIGMAQALGETAPLLMIGMIAFIVDIPSGPLDPSTVLPVQIFMWADFPEPAFQQKTSAAILVLLAFLVTMNALAVVLRKRFERRW